MLGISTSVWDTNQENWPLHLPGQEVCSNTTSPAKIPKKKYKFNDKRGKLTRHLSESGRAPNQHTHTHTHTNASVK